MKPVYDKAGMALGRTSYLVVLFAFIITSFIPRLGKKRSSNVDTLDKQLVMLIVSKF